MQKQLLQSLLKSKADENITLEELIDKFINQTSKQSANVLKKELSDLLVFIDKYHEVDKKHLLELIKLRCEQINIPFEYKELESLYEKIALKHNEQIALALGTSPIALSFNRVDIDTINSMRKNFYWVGREYNEKFQTRLKDIIEEAFRGDLPRVELASKLREEFTDLFNFDTRYFQGVADHIILQNQNIARVNQASKYGVKHYQIVAVIDSKTSKICRSMHGRIISAKHIETQTNNIINANNMANKKAAATWQNEAFYGKDLPKNFGLPPFHFRCRTEIEPVWVKEEEHKDSKTGKSFKTKSVKIDDKDVALSHIDKTNVQVQISNGIYNKITNKHKMRKKEVVGVLNDIKYKAPHSDNHKRSVALSNKGYTVVYESDKIITMFKPEQKAREYFNRNAVLSKIVDVDSGKIIERVKKWYEII